MKSLALPLAFGILAVACNEQRPGPIRPPLDGVGQPCPSTDPNCRSTNPESPQTDPNSRNPPYTRNDSLDDTRNTDPPPPLPSPTQAPGTTTNTTTTTGGNDCPADSVCKSFSAGEREACRQFVLDKAICDSDRWGKTFYEGIIRDLTCSVQVSSAALRSTASTSGTTLGTLPVGTLFFKVSGTTVSCDSGLNFYKAEATVDGTKKIGFVCSKNIRCGP